MSELAQAISYARRGNMSGAAALVAAIIGQAAIDAQGDDTALKHDALAYFRSPVYQHHLTSLGLAEGMLPRGMETAVIETLPIFGD